MVSISLCMIVKNEEAVLARCLDTVADLVDEIIIVDTGSSDKTKEIARKYTKNIYDFQWIDDFSAARNFAFSKATKDYIYSADADEVLDEENRQRFRILKEGMLPEIEIVQMMYGNQLEHGTVYNYDKEYRPKLFKRQRQFVWEEAIHEQVRLQPVVFDSDIVITHMPEQSHAKRDLQNFYKQTQAGNKLSKRLQNMYAKELFLCGDAEDFIHASDYFAEVAADVERTSDEVMEACLVVAKAARLVEEPILFFKYAMKVVAGEGCSEVCCELGHFYEQIEDYEEAAIWFYNAAYETEPVLALASKEKESLEGLVRCYEKMGIHEEAAFYKAELQKK